MVLCPLLWSCAARADDLQDQVAHLKAQLAAQEEQINRLRKTLDEQRAVLDKLTPMIPPAHATEPDSTPVTAPLLWTLGGVSITPQGFLDLGGVFRSGTAGSGFPTKFGSVPFPDTVNGICTKHA